MDEQEKWRVEVLRREGEEGGGRIGRINEEEGWMRRNEEEGWKEGCGGGMGKMDEEEGLKEGCGGGMGRRDVEEG